jgi:hypothetical protein
MASGQTDEFSERFFSRSKELTKDGFDLIHAHGIVWLEEQICQWPSGWGDDLHVLIYGDFKQPQMTIDIPHLGIVIHPENLTNTVIGNAMTVLKAVVKIKEKSVPELLDAARRINVLLGASTLVEWGNVGCGWWSYVTHGAGGGVISKLEHQDLHRAVDGILALPADVRHKVDAALYWVREPKGLFQESYRNDRLRVYVGYWNAFECLVEAVSIIRPAPKLNRTQKQQLIDDLLAKHHGVVDQQFIHQAYQEIVNPGFVGKAKHALRVCFEEEADHYIRECFTLPQRQDRLYDIRNAINHGNIDAENMNEILRVEARRHRLWMIVWKMFGRLVPFPAPMDNQIVENQ